MVGGSSQVTLKLSHKRTFEQDAAYGTLGSFLPFAAVCTNDRFGPEATFDIKDGYPSGRDYVCSISAFASERGGSFA
jgi:hypothetical protein